MGRRGAEVRATCGPMPTVRRWGIGRESSRLAGQDKEPFLRVNSSARTKGVATVLDLPDLSFLSGCSWRESLSRIPRTARRLPHQ